MRFSSRLLSGLCAVLVAGCGPEPMAKDSNDSDDRDDRDEQLEWADAGIPDRPDAGSTEIEICIPVAPLPPEDLPRCTAATRDCILGCPEDDAGEECRNTCWTSDTTPPLGDVACQNCIFVQLLSCMDLADEGVCHASVAEYLCCLASGGECPTEANNMFTCGFVSEPSCFELTSGMIGQCYAES
jgi:hypothetical protein